MSRARRTLPDKPPLALPIGRRLRRRTVHCVHDVQPREHQELVEHVDNNLRRRAPTVRQPRAYRSIRHARRHRRDQLGRKQQSGTAIGSKGNSRGPVAHTTLLDHRKIHQSAAYASATAGEAARFRSSEFAAAAAPASTGLAADRRDLHARPEQPRAGFGLHGAIAIDGLGGYGRGRARVRAYMPIYCVSRASSKSHRAKCSSRPWPRRN